MPTSTKTIADDNSNRPAQLAAAERERELDQEIREFIDGASEPPVIPALRVQTSLTFYCGWCRCWHWHSVHGACDSGCSCPMHANLHGRHERCTCPLGSGDGHRGAHCTPSLFRTRPSSPWIGTGYILREVPASEFMRARAS
jgi:hypothetical protein